MSVSDLVVMPKSDWKGILDSVRAKTGKTELMASGVVADEIERIPTGGGSTINNQNKTINKNGVYTADSGYTGLGTVTVNVADDDAVAIKIPSKDVNFYDYDGTLLYAYTVAEAQALTELPELPTQNGLICQGWNYDLETIKSHNRAVDVGAIYITDDGKTRLYIKIAAEGRMTVPLYFSQSVANGVVIDWGDGSDTETLSGTGKVSTAHTYASIGEYVISLEVAQGLIKVLGDSSNTGCVMGDLGTIYSQMLWKVEIGYGLTSPGPYAFANCFNLTYITMPNGMTASSTNAFQNCGLKFINLPSSMTIVNTGTFYGCGDMVGISIPNGMETLSTESFFYCGNLTHINIPDSVTTISKSAFSKCRNFKRIDIPSGVSNISASLFTGCVSITSITIPAGVTNIDTYAFGSCTGMVYYDFTACTAVPTLSNITAFAEVPADCQIRVPAALYDEWIVATNWSTYADKIVAV